MRMWLLLAFLSAATAAAVAIFGKLGLKGVDSTLATALRSIIMAAFMVSAALLLGKFKGFTWGTLDGKAWIYITLAGVAGALSWLFYFWAIKIGNVSAVAAIDKLSIVFVVILAALFLGESFTKFSAIGAALITLGALLIAFDSKVVTFIKTLFS